VARLARPYYGWRIAGALAITETVSWGIVYYSFSVFLVPMETELGATRAQLSFAFSLALLLSGAAAIPVGWWLDRHGSRALMTAGSLAAAGLVWAWSRAESLAGLYLIFAGLGLTMAAVLYDPAFAVLTAWFSRRRRRALTLLTLVAGLASTIFVPLSTWLLGQLGWRSALAVLAATLLLVTVPLHALVLRRRPQDLGLALDGDLIHQPSAGSPQPSTSSRPARAVLRSAPFWLLTTAFMLSSGVSVAAGVHFIPYLLGQSHTAAFAAGLAGLIGLMQLPGRLLYDPLGQRVPRRWLTAGSLLLQGGALLLLFGTPGASRLVAFVIFFGMANGVLTLARATGVADLFGSAHYGSLSGVMAFWITLARAAGPSAVALLYAAAGRRYEWALLLMVGVMAFAALAYLAAEHAGQRQPLLIIRGQTVRAGDSLD